MAAPSSARASLCTGVTPRMVKLPGVPGPTMGPRMVEPSGAQLKARPSDSLSWIDVSRVGPLPNNSSSANPVPLKIQWSALAT